MKRILISFAALAAISCSSVPATVESPEEIKDAISAEKKSWVISTKSSDDRFFAKDIPWKEGDKVLLLGSDQNLDNCLQNREDINGHPFKKTICTVVKADGLKCELVSQTPIEEGTYRAVFPVYDYAWYDYLHLSFLYEDWNELDYTHQDIVISDPVEFTQDHKMSFVMKHVCALVDIDIYPPKSGSFSYLKLFAQYPSFAGKAEYFIDKEYDVNEIASGWLNYTTLRGSGRDLKEGELFQTSTGLLPIQYDGMQMRVHIVYTDGTHYISEPIAMPSLSFGLESNFVVKDFKQTFEPFLGMWGEYYGDQSGEPFPVD